MKQLPFAGTGIALLLSACDPVYGVQTSLKLQEPVNVTCLDQALRNTSDVGNVEFRQTQSDGFEVAPNWGHVTDVTKYWLYGDGGATGSAILQVHENKDGSYLLNGLTRMGVRIPDDQIKAYLPLMHRVNSSVEASCGIPLNSTGSVKHF